MNKDTYLDSYSNDIIREVVNVGVGDAADALSKLVKSPVKISVPEISIIDIGEIAGFAEKEMKDIGVFISQEFTGEIKGRALLAYSRECSQSLLATIMSIDKEITALTKIEISTLEEIGNLILVSCISTIGDMIENPFSFELPMVSTSGGETFFRTLARKLQEDQKCIVAKNKMVVKEKMIEGYIFIFLRFSDINRIIESLKKNGAAKPGR